MSEVDTPLARIDRGTGISPDRVGEVVQVALEELHRIAAIEEEGPSASVMAACFAFGP